jgi:hypothetical protein
MTLELIFGMLAQEDKNRETKINRYVHCRDNCAVRLMKLCQKAVLSNTINFFTSKKPRCAAQRMGSPAADLNNIKLHKTTFSTQWPPRNRAGGGQVEPVLGGVISYTPRIFRI